MPLAPNPVPVPSFFQSELAKTEAFALIVNTHLSSISTSIISEIQTLILEGKSLPAGLALILPELEKFGSDFFTLVQLVQQVLAVRATPVIPPVVPPVPAQTSEQAAQVTAA